VSAQRCIATSRRVRWAWLRTGWPREHWHSDLAGLTMDEARLVCRLAGVPLAALYLPDPSRWEMFKAWLYGKVATPLPGSRDDG
jgi:hypothetical protein